MPKPDQMSTKRRPSRASGKRQITTHVSKNKSSLKLDTTFLRHNAQTPTLVFPYESKTHQLSFVSLADLRALNKDGKGGLKQTLESALPVRPAAGPSVSDSTTPQGRAAISSKDAVRPPLARSQTAAVLQPAPPVEHLQHEMPPAAPPMHKRVKGLRPAPLNLSQDVSPNDRVIPIGIAIPYTSLSCHTNSPATTAPYPQSPPLRQQSQRRQRERGNEPTPTILITPAKEDFGLSRSPQEIEHARNYRPASSVYSRHADCAPNFAAHGAANNIPPLPLFLTRMQALRDSTTTVFEEEASTAVKGRHGNALSVCTVFEEDAPVSTTQQRNFRHSLLPTPRRSRGWWNVITSPFSAGSKSNAFFWRSPSLPEEDNGDDDEPILQDAAAMGASDLHAGVVFMNRAPDDDNLHSAPPSSGAESTRPPMPRRSDSAPGAFNSGEDAVDIYEIPSQGEAAADYDSNRHFPSLCLEPSADAEDRDLLDGWSPSHSVAYPQDASCTWIDSQAADVSKQREGDGSIVKAQHHTRGGGDSAERGRLSDAHDEAAPTGVERAIFSTPAEEELQSTSLGRPGATRSITEGTLDSHLSPFSATPVLEHAHVATLVGPHSSRSELRQVELPQPRSTTPPDNGLGVATMASRDVDESDATERERSEKAPYPSALHSRNDLSDSRGLGISDARCERELFSVPPQSLSEKRRLGTDRFGQLTVRNAEEQRPTSPKPSQRRFCWLLAALIACLLVIIIVLLVIFVPQGHMDIPVEAQWLNLTGFPPMPTGIATVVKLNAVKEIHGCVSSPNLWSCAGPTEEDQANDAPDQPDFRLEIRFRNGTLPSNETGLAKRSSASPAVAGTAMRRDGWTSSLYRSDPSPPSINDQAFIGQTTDNISVPYIGEETPFYISLLNPTALISSSPRNLRKRQSAGNPYPYPTPPDSNASFVSTNASTSAATRIPRPALKENGEPAPVELYPLPTAQPLRLYNRGHDDEHYGFYTYFDRSLYLSDTSASGDAGNGTASSNGSVPLAEASAVCTWSQTRLHVQIWTRKNDVTSLGTSIPLNGPSAVNSTANDMMAPGSFPYPVTITLDRHGGDVSLKGVYCYGLDGKQRVNQSEMMWVNEDRAFGGTLVNAAAVPSNNATATSFMKRSVGGQAHGGVDGGSGGCSCQWQNWQ